MEPTVIEVKIGNLFESEAQTLVNTVNCVGVMGKGVALEFKNRFPEMFEDYLERCKAGNVKLGIPYLYRQLIPPWILNFPTKDHWRSVSRISDIIRGINYLKNHYKEWEITSIAFPPLGCGEGQLDWKIVGPILYNCLQQLDIPVVLYAPFGTESSALQADFLTGALTKKTESNNAYSINPGWIAVVEIVAKLENNQNRRTIGRIIFQKIAYFATAIGIPTGAKYIRCSYGPFSKEIKPMITKLVNNGLIREERYGNMQAIRTSVAYKEASQRNQKMLNELEDKINRIVDLFKNMDSSSAETASTVHFVANELIKQKKIITENDILNEVKNWKLKRRPPLDDLKIIEAIHNLNNLNWLSITNK